jgi:hypothetical protein
MLEPGSSSYHTVSVDVLDGPLDTAAFEAALHRLMSRHDALRIALVDSSPPRQRVVPDVALPLETRAISESEREQAVRALVESPFDLTGGPLWRVGLFQLSEARHVLTWVMHHIVAGMSCLSGTTITTCYRRSLARVSSKC